MSCSYCDKCLGDKFSLRRCMADNCANSTDNYLHHLCQTQFEFDNGIDAELHYQCRACVKKQINVDKGASNDIQNTADVAADEVIAPQAHVADDDAPIDANVVVTAVEDLSPEKKKRNVAMTSRNFNKRKE